MRKWPYRFCKLCSLATVSTRQELKLAELNIDHLISKLKEFDALRDADTISQDEVDRIQPAYADEWPALLNPSVREAMVNSGVARPYQHQVDAIVKALSGANVVMESPTASGKTLAFTAPMLHVLKGEPRLPRDDDLPHEGVGLRSAGANPPSL